MRPVDLFVDDAGRADHETVLFLGSLGSTHRMWEPQSRAFGDDYRVLCPDTRGHGNSPVPTGPYSIAGLSADIIALLDRLGVERAHVVGLSLGGMIAMEMASSYPERVRSLAVLSTSARLGPREAWTERAALVRGTGTAAVSSAVVGRWFTADFAAANPGLIADMQRMIEHTPAEGYAACCEAIAEMDLRDRLGAISAPTLVIAGRDDPATPPERLQAIASAVQNATYLELSPAAHLVSWEQQVPANVALRKHFDNS